MLDQNDLLMTQKVLKILLLEDVDDDVGLVKETLKRDNIQFEAKCVDSREEFFQGLKEFRPDVILSDHALPQFNSMEALKIYKEFGLEIPFILVTGTVSEEFAVQCLKEGADDYVLKSNLVRLPTAIVNALEKRANELYRKKAEYILRSQNQQLIKINKELDSFVYSVSHNLRSPLTSVLGLVNIARMDNKTHDPVLDHYFNLMESSINKLDETLKGIIDYSKNSRFELDIKKLDLEEVIDNCLNKLKSLNGFDRVVKKITVDQKVSLYSDEFRLSVIISNLLSNAIVFRDDRRDPYIDIAAEVNSDYATFRIADNGIGITEKFLPKIFTMFFRAADRSIGPGLGLYIVKETVEKLKGEIEVYSRLAVGSTFSVKIPNLSSPLLSKSDYEQVLSGINKIS